MAVGILGGLVIFVGVTAASEELLEREKVGPFECGFTSLFTARLPFSMRFFMLTIIFLIFDVELVLLFPILIRLVYARGSHNMVLLGGVLFVLGLGVAHEWACGGLDWAL